MKKLLIIFTCLIPMMLLSFPSYSKWTEVSKSGKENTNYLDFERIRKNNGFIYFWTMGNYNIPIKGFRSEVNYRQADCKIFRYKILGGSFYKEPMGEGTPIRITPDPDWRYAQPGTVAESFLQSVCPL